MMGNEPQFDPLNPTPEEEVEMCSGYRDEGLRAPVPSITSMAYDHGRRMRRNDCLGIVDDDQRGLARRAVEKAKATL